MTFICRCNAEFKTVEELDAHQLEAHGLYVTEILPSGMRVYAQVGGGS